MLGVEADRSAPELRRLTRLRMQMIERHPFWGYLLLQVRLVPSPSLPALTATDAIRHIWFNPRFTAQLPDRELGFVITHLLVHQLFATASRRGNRDLQRWHRATDYVVNRIVAAIPDPADSHGRPLYTPPDRTIIGLGAVRTLLDARYHRLVAESIYERLRAEPDVGGDDSSADSSDANGDAGGDAGTLNVEVQAMTDGGAVPITFMNVAQHNGGFDLHLPFALDARDRETIADRLAEAVEHWEASGRHGHTPGNLLRSLGVLEPPQVPWQRLLHRFFDEALAKSEYSRTRPNKRYLASDIVVPSLNGDEVEHIVVALDVSGSMSNAAIRSALSEIRSVAQYATEVTCIVADEMIQHVLTLEELDAFIRIGQVRGGGGTSHLPVFAYIDQERIRPTVFIGLTDLESTFPEQAPTYPVLWIAPATHGPAPWGQVVVVR
jgi:predicted metal-dependent peptidase